MERYQVVGHLRLDPEGTVTSYADAQATVEALQAHNTYLISCPWCFEKMEPNATLAIIHLIRCGDTKQEALQRERDALNKIVHHSNFYKQIKELEAALDAEREKVQGLEANLAHAKRYSTTDAVLAKVAEIESLQNELTQLQALVRENMTLLRDYTFLDAEPPELRAQNERAHRIACELLKAKAALTPAEGGKDEHK